MPTLRVLVHDPWDAERPEAYVLVDRIGRSLGEGRAVAARWPAHDRLEMVLAGPHVRIVPVLLPPMPAQRIAAAARFALEDQWAGSDAGMHVAIGPRAADGAVAATLVARDWMSAIAARRGPFANLAKVVAEPDLLPADAALHWCVAKDATSGFLRLPDGTALPAGFPARAGALPAEVTAAIAHCRSQRADTAVAAHASSSSGDLERWSRETATRWVAAAPWDWAEASAARIGEATDLLQGEFAATAAAKAPSLRRALLPAAWVLGAALGLHLIATIGHWGWLQLDAWRAAGEWRELGRAANLPEDALATPAAAQRSLKQRYAEVLHAHLKPADADALVLLARAAPAFAVLPPGTLRRAVYGDGHWLLEVATTDAALLDRLAANLRLAGAEVLIARTDAGARIRLGWT